MKNAFFITPEQPNTQQGFTIIELMYSMAIFSVILLAAAAGIIQIGRIYFKGVIASRTQNAARQVIDDISRPIQFSGQQPVLGGPVILSGVEVKSVCIGNDRYSYVIDGQVDTDVAGYDPATRKIRHALWQDRMLTSAFCIPPDLTQPTPSDGFTDSSIPGKELLSTHMRLTEFGVVPPAVGSSELRYFINIGVLYGDEDLLECDDGAGGVVECSDPSAIRTTARCTAGFSGISAQFCAASKLNTTVIRRLR